MEALSLFRFHLSPFPPETPDTQAILALPQVTEWSRTVPYMTFLSCELKTAVEYLFLSLVM